LIKIEDPELERLLADASAASGVEPGALLASLLRERVSMANDKENQGSVNPKSENAGFGDITPQKNTIDKSQGELYEENSLTASPLPPDPNTYNKKRDITITSPSPESWEMSSPRDRDPGSVRGREGGSSSEQSIPVSELARFFSSRRKDSKMINTRLHNDLYRDIELLASKYGLTPTTFNRIILILVDMGWKYGIVDIDDLLHFTTLVPKLVMPINLNINNNNVNVGRPPYRKYERELEEPHLKAEFRNLAEEILKGPPKEKKWDHYNYIYVEVPPTPEKVAKWRAEKSDALIALLKRMDKLKIQLTPEENELFSKVKEKLDPIHG